MFYNIFRRKFKKTKIFFLILLLFIIIYTIFFKKNENTFISSNFDYERAKIGNIRKIVSATGNIYPSDIVEIGSQVSGIVNKVYVDYNSRVKKNQLLALIDTTTLKRELEQYKSMLNQSKSKLKYIKLETGRIRELYKNNYVPKSELDQAEYSLNEGIEDLKIAQLRYDNAKTQLGYAYIKSPINGIVTSREVDEGQTVAANFSAPTLFRIAKDLKKMNIETSISESDISLIKEGSDVEFTVDAYKTKNFVGKIKQIRYNPSLEENVVVYNVIIEIDNEDELLLPGMTAYVIITIDEVHNVLTIPNTVFRFKVNNNQVRRALCLPEPTNEQMYKYREIMKDKNNAIIYVIRNKKPIPIVVKKGLSDITNTQITSDNLNHGDEIISSYLIKNKK